MRKVNIFLVSILFSTFLSTSFGIGASFDKNNINPIGFELLENNTVAHIWNPDDDYFFNHSSGIQFTNHFNEYWTHNIFCAGYKHPVDGWKYDCNDALPFTWSKSTDNATYVNITGYKDKTISGRTIRFAIRYHLKLNDTKLSIILYEKNIGSLDVPYDTGFAWRVNDIKISNDVENDQLLVNRTYYWLNESLDLRFTNMNQSEYVVVDYNKPNYLILQWNENLNYFLDAKSTAQYNAPITLGINAGTLSVGQSKTTTMYWKDAVQYLVPTYDINYTGWETTDPGNMLYWSEIDESVFSPDESDYIYNTENNSVIRFGLSNCPSNFDPVTNLSVMMYSAPDYDYDGSKKLYEFTVYWTIDDGVTYSSPLFNIAWNSTPKIYNFIWNYISLTQEQCDNLQLEIRGIVVNGTKQNKQKIFALNVMVDNATVQFNKTAFENFTFNDFKNETLSAFEKKIVNLTTTTLKKDSGTFPNIFSSIIKIFEDRTETVFSFIKPKDELDIYGNSLFNFLAVNKFVNILKINDLTQIFLNVSERFRNILLSNTATKTTGAFFEKFQGVIKIFSDRVTYFFAPIKLTDRIVVKRVTNIPYLFALHSPVDFLKMLPDRPINLIFTGVEHFVERLEFTYTGRKHLFYPSSAEEIECFGYCPASPQGGGATSISRDVFSIDLLSKDIGYSVGTTPVEVTVANKEQYNNYDFEIQFILLDENNTLYNYQSVNGTMDADIIHIREKLYLPLATTGKELNLIVRGVSRNYITEKEHSLKIPMINVFVITSMFGVLILAIGYYRAGAKKQIGKLKRIYRRYIIKIGKKRKKKLYK